MVRSANIIVDPVPPISVKTTVHQTKKKKFSAKLKAPRAKRPKHPDTEPDWDIEFDAEYVEKPNVSVKKAYSEAQSQS